MNRLHWIAVGGLALGLGLVGFAGWRFLLTPLAAERAAKLAEKEAAVAKLQEAKRRANQFEKFKAEAENVRRDLDYYTRRLDPSLPVTEVFNQLEELGNSFNFLEWSFDVKARAKTKTKGLDLDDVLVKASFKADYDRLGQFLNAAANRRRLFVAEAINIQRLIDADGVYRNTLKADLDLRVYVSAEAKR
jgi:Tfp pilus assembly protein PilO